MGRQRAGQGCGRQVAPEDALLIARLLGKEPSVRPSVRSRDVVKHVRRRLKPDAIAGAIEPKSEIDVFKVGAEALRERTNMQESVAPEESARSAGAEDTA